MPDRSVYLVEAITPAMIKEEALVFIDDAKLGELLGEGWEVSTTLAARKVMVGGKRITADMLILKKAEENRGVAVAERREVQGPPPSGGAGMTVTDEFGFQRNVSIPQAMVEALQGLNRGLSNMGEHTGHLGAPGQHNIPGLSIISGKTISQAYDVGLLAGARGCDKSANIFPEGTVPHTKWLQGWNDSRKVATQKITQASIDEAEEIGYKLAVQLGAGDDVVNCPHSHPVLKAAWIRGFKRGGGVVE